MSVSFKDIVVATTVSLGVFLLSYLSGRSFSAGQPLTAIQKAILGYGFVFMLGISYLVVFAGRLDWSAGTKFSLMLIWAGVVALLAFWRHHQT